MKKLVFRALALVMALAGCICANAQMPNLPELPVDPAVRVGHLDNGLTYYIRYNANPKGQADFYIAQKVGSILEEDNQRGLAHFLEHMCFNGTEHFPGNSLIDYLESVGVKFGQNLNAYTSIDETVYNISSVPTARESVQDSCLLILHDWANALLLDPEEIEKERGVIHEEWRRSNAGQMRVLTDLLPVMYPGSRYGVRLPIGTMEVVDNFPPQALRDYYETWYRPDQQGIIVVGDIDPDRIEAKIIELFSPIEMPANAPERVYFPVEDTPGTIYAIGSDPEVKSAVFSLMFKNEKLLPREARNTQIYFPVTYMTSMVSNMLNTRLNELSMKPEAEFAGASASLGDYYVASTVDALSIDGAPKGNDIIPALKAVYRELLRAARYGFTSGEYERARDEFLSGYERAYNNRNDRRTESYSKELVGAFTDNDPIPGIEMEYEAFKQIAPMFDVNTLNSLLPELISDNNRVFLAVLPQNDEFVIPTQEQVAQAIAEVEAEEIAPYEDQTKTEPFIPELPKPGKIVSESSLAQWGATEIVLSNGVHVIVKPTDFKENQIVFDAIAKNGTAQSPAELAPVLKFLRYAVNSNGLGTYNSQDVTRYLMGKQVGIKVLLSDYERSVYGNSTIKDLPTLMELIYMTFTNYYLDADEYSAMQQALSSQLANQEVSPEYQFSKLFREYMFEAPQHQMISVADIENADRAQMEQLVKQALSNAADYTFVFVGNLDMDTLRPLLEQYIATLPADAATVDTKIVTNPAVEYTRGPIEVSRTTPMQTPQVWTFIGFGGHEEYNTANAVMAEMAASILGNRLLKKVREEMGATYSIGCYEAVDGTNDYDVFFQIAFPMKPEVKDEVIDLIHQMVQDMTSTITADEINPIKEFLVKEATEAQEENGDWRNAITNSITTGVDTFHGKVDVVNSITIEQLQNFMANLLKQNNYRVITLEPEVAE